MNRRDFLRYTATGLAGSLIGSSTLLHAEGLERNICLVYLRGGWDDRYILPLTGGDAFNSLAAIRPSIHVTSSDILIPSALANATQRIGLHKDWSRLVSVAGNNIRIITKVGALPFGNEPNKSHDDCQRISISGTLNVAAAKGLVGEAHNHYNLKLFNTIGIGGNPQHELDSPTIINLSGFGEYARLNATGSNYACNEYNRTLTVSNNMLHAREVMSTLDDIDKNNRFSKLFKDSKDAMKSSVQDVQSKINSVQARGDYRRYNSSNQPWYVGHSGHLLREAFRYFAAPNLGVKTKISQLSIGGWDTHEFQRNYLRDRVEELAAGLRGFTEDCINSGIWNKTAVLLVTEFGRTVRDNGGEGTDHGFGTSHLALSGAFGGKVIGDSFTPSDWSNTEHYNPTLSYLSTVNDLFRWAGLPLDQLIEPPFTASTVGLFS